MRKITMQGIDIPEVSYHGDSNRYRVNYGHSRGYANYDTKRQANKVLSEHLDDRIHTLAHELEALCKLQRKTLKELI